VLNAQKKYGFGVILDRLKQHTRLKTKLSILAKMI
jgi:hypothetical protein